MFLERFERGFFKVLTCSFSAILFLKIFGGHQSFLWGKCNPIFGLLMMSSLDFKAKMHPHSCILYYLHTTIDNSVSTLADLFGGQYGNQFPLPTQFLSIGGNWTRNKVCGKQSLQLTELLVLGSFQWWIFRCTPSALQNFFFLIS